MAPKFNAAFRVYTLLNLATHQNMQGKTIEAWEKVFDISVEGVIERNLVVVEMLNLLYIEVKLVHEQARSSGFSPDLYEDIFQSIYSAMNIEAIYNPWQGYATHLNTTVLRMLRVLSESFENEEEQIEASVLKELMIELDDLEFEVKSSNLPPEIKAFFLRHILILRNAARNYNILGKRAFRNAFMQSAADITMPTTSNYGEEVLQEARSFSERLGKAWSTVKERVNDVETLALIVQGTQFALEKTPQIIKLLGNITNS